MEQSTAGRLVTITYSVDAEAVVTLDVQTNATANAEADDPGWASIGGEAIWNAAGDVWRKVSSGSHTITWRPDLSWPDHKIADGCARAVVTAWAVDNTPDYMVVDLAAAETVRYYPAVDFLPGTVPGQTGAITNNPAYKTSKLVMRKIMAAGVEWTMGSGTGETQRDSAREKAFPVTLANNYYIGVFEVTQAQWKNIATNSARVAYFTVQGDMRPMENVCYNELRNTHSTVASGNVGNGTLTADPSSDSFLGLLRLKTGLDFDLPSEAQWEFAARAGHGSGYWNNGTSIENTATDENLKRLGRYKGNNPSASDTSTFALDEGGTAIVGSYDPSDWGLYDMHGNVFEWCLDYFKNTTPLEDISQYGGAVNINPTDPSKTRSGLSVAHRVKRGGRYGNDARYCRPAVRENEAQKAASKNNGFRVVCTAGLQ